MTAFLSFPTRPSSLENAAVAMIRGETAPKGQRTAVALAACRGDKIAADIIQRGAALVGTTTDSGFSSEISQSLVGEFLATLGPLSAAAALMRLGIQIPLASAKELKLPAREGAPSSTVGWVGEAEPIPVRSYVVNDDCLLSPRKHGFIIGVSREVAKRGEAAVRQMIREDAAATLDGAYFSDEAGDTVKHAGMLAGISPLTGYAGGDKLAMETDLIALTDAVGVHGSGQVAFITSPARALRIKIKAPQLDLPFLPSLAVADNTVIAVDPLSWVHGLGNDFDLDAATESTIHMSDDPDPIVTTDPTVADPVRSFWQTDSIAFRLIADVAFAARRPSAVAFCEAVSW